MKEVAFGLGVVLVIAACMYMGARRIDRCEKLGGIYVRDKCIKGEEIDMDKADER